ncbi:MAG: hypothetical protein KDK27_05200, partial [Leptospiraceae bacterium]|nr:hypothetical protein [Leptospiraceae bacterium]
QISGLGPAAYSEALDHAVEMDDRHSYMNIQNRQYVIFRGTRDGSEYLIGFSYAAYRSLLARYSLGSAIIGLSALAILYALLIFYWRDYRRNFAGNYRMPYRLPPGRASSSALRKARGSSSRGGA